MSRAIEVNTLVVLDLNVQLDPSHRSQVTEGSDFSVLGLNIQLDMIKLSNWIPVTDHSS